MSSALGRLVNGVRVLGLFSVGSIADLQRGCGSRPGPDPGRDDVRLTPDLIRGMT